MTEYMASSETKALNKKLQGKVISDYKLYKRVDHELVVLSFSDGSKLELKSYHLYYDMDDEYKSGMDRTFSYLVSESY